MNLRIKMIPFKNINRHYFWLQKKQNVYYIIFQFVCWILKSLVAFSLLYKVLTTLSYLANLKINVKQINFKNCI